MDLVYIFNGRLPTQKAHGFQVAKSCEAFGQMPGLNFEAWLPYRHNPIKETIEAYYGLKHPFKIRRLWAVDPFIIGGFPHWLGHYIQVITSVKRILLAAIRRGRKSIYYTRDYATAFWLSLFGFKTVIEIHDYRHAEPKGWVRSLLHRVHRVVVNSPGTLKAMTDHFAFAREKTLVAPNGVDLNFFDISESQIEARKALKLPEDGVLIGYVGRLETLGMDKGIPFLLKTFAKDESLGQRARILVIGGPDKMVADYKTYATNLGISTDRVIFTGHVPYGRVPVYMRALDIATIPFPRQRQFEETVALIKVFEYLAAGKPIVASDFPALRAYLDESNTLFFDAENSTDLAEKLNRLVNDVNLRQSMSAHAKQSAQNHTLTKRAEQIINFIQ